MTLPTLRRAVAAFGLVLASPFAPAPPVRAEAPPAHHHGAGLRPGDHAPIGVMGDHRHAAGEWMLSYRYARMSMRGNRDDTGRLGSDEVLRSFPVTPTSMDAEMHMLGLMWAPVDAATLMVMVPWLRKDMDHRTRAGGRFTTRTDGLGDVSLTALVRLFEDGTHRLHANAGLSFPTGSTTEKDDTPMGRVRLPYPMQLGSGTWDLLPGLTYSGRRDALTWGAQLRGTIRTGRNDEGYRLGHAYGATAWLAHEILPSLGASLRLDWSQWGDIEGDDGRLNPRLVPTADPDLRAGRRLDLLLGLNWVMRKGPLAGHRLALEVGRPVYQDLDGPQLEVDWRAIAGWQYAF